ncbi:hypothetical protein I7I48_05296 [Histoplasma ohiense]|nr:hypothetical protein I7I48_05296 [Histoplasma ohiense (nom. inval.)]
MVERKPHEDADSISMDGRLDIVGGSPQLRIKVACLYMDLLPLFFPRVGRHRLVKQNLTGPLKLQILYFSGDLAQAIQSSPPKLIMTREPSRRRMQPPPSLWLVANFFGISYFSTSATQVWVFPFV